MEVMLLDFTGVESRDPARYAADILIYAKSTRLTQGLDLLTQISTMGDKEIEANLEAVRKSIKSSWEFVHYTWQITGVTRAFTHQFVRSRHASYAQQAQRVVDMSDFETLMPQKIKDVDGGNVWNEAMTFVSRAYKYYHNEDVPAEDCRGLLPTNIYTNIMCSMNLRAFAEAVGKRSSMRVQSEYRQVIHKMAGCVIEVHPWTEKFLFPDDRVTPALDAILAKKLDNRPPASVPYVNDAIKELEALKQIW